MLGGVLVWMGGSGNWGFGRRGRHGKIQQNGGLFDGHLARVISLDGEEATVDLIAAPVFDGSCEEVEPVGGFGVEIVEDAAALEIGCSVDQEVFADSLKQGMAGGDTLQSGAFFKEFFVKNNILVFASEFAEAGFEAFADGPELAGNAANAIDFGIVIGFLGLDARGGSGINEEILNDLGHEAAFLGLGGFADDGGDVQLFFGKKFEGAFGDTLEPGDVHVLDDALLDDFLGHLVVGVHVANHLFQLILGEDVPQHIEDFAGVLGIEIGFDGLDALEEFLRARPSRVLVETKLKMRQSFSCP